MATLHRQRNRDKADRDELLAAFAVAADQGGQEEEYYEDEEEEEVEEESGFIEAMRRSFCFRLIKCLIEELIPCLLTSELFTNTMILAQRSLRENPCSTFLYTSLVIFGFLPFWCFVMFVCATFIFSAICFIVAQGIAITLGALMFGGFFMFIIAMCCILATVFGLAIHILSAWGFTHDWLSNNAANTYRQVKEAFGTMMQWFISMGENS